MAFITSYEECKDIFDVHDRKFSIEMTDVYARRASEADYKTYDTRTSFQKLMDFFGEFVQNSPWFHKSKHWFKEIELENKGFDKKNPYTWFGDGKCINTTFNEWREKWIETLKKYDKENGNEELSKQQLLCIEDTYYTDKMKELFSMFSEDVNIDFQYNEYKYKKKWHKGWSENNPCSWSEVAHNLNVNYAWGQIIACYHQKSNSDYDALRFKFILFLLNNKSYFQYWMLIENNPFHRHRTYCPCSDYFLKKLEPKQWISYFRRIGDWEGFDNLERKWRDYVR